MTLVVARFAIALVVAGCSLLPAEVVCKGVGPTRCQRLAGEIITRKNAEDPSRRVVRLVITGDLGGYELTWDDGRGESMYVD